MTFAPASRRTSAAGRPGAKPDERVKSDTQLQAQSYLFHGIKEGDIIGSIQDIDDLVQ